MNEKHEFELDRLLFASSLEFLMLLRDADSLKDTDFPMECSSIRSIELGFRVAFVDAFIGWNHIVVAVVACREIHQLEEKSSNLLKRVVLW